MKLGPEGFDKIAIIGSAVSSTLLAPFDDPSWAIWGCSPGAFAQIASKRSDVWFELHRWMPYLPGQSGAPGTRPWLSPEYTTFLKQYKGPVFMTDPRNMKIDAPWQVLYERDHKVHESIPNSVPFPFQQLITKHGRYHFSSTIAWMLAFAIEQKPKAIGLFGVDMAAGEEWAYQRPACQHFVGMCKQLGIQVYLPPESDLMRPSTMYGIGEHSQRHVKLRERLVELESRIGQSKAIVQQHSASLQFMEGQATMLRHFLEVWTDNEDEADEEAFSFAGTHVAKFVDSTPEPVSTGAEVLKIPAVGG